MDNSKFRNILIPDTTIYLWIIAILIGISAFYNKIIGVIGAVVLVYLIYYNWRIAREKRARLTEYVENLSINIDAATQKSLLELPIPLVIIEEDGTIMWYNSEFSIICEQKELLEEKINEVFKDIDIKDILGNNDKVKKPLIENIEGRTYEILSNSVEVSGYRGRRKTIILLYLIDRTLYYQMKEKYNQEKHTIAFIQIDNYQDVMQSTSENNRSLVVAAIDRKLNRWATRLDALIKKFSSDQYILVFEKDT